MYVRAFKYLILFINEVYEDKITDDVHIECLQTTQPQYYVVEADDDDGIIVLDRVGPIIIELDERHGDERTNDSDERTIDER